MRYLVLSDIHANFPAFSAVLDAAAGKYDKILFLGDLANFGPHPTECVELLQSLNAICIMGNHDEQIISNSPKHIWDKWAKDKLSNEQLEWLGAFEKSRVIDGHILAIHGVYTVPYDILPNTSDEDIERAFKGLLPQGIDEVWFGHYHYQIERVINGITYRCIRPVGHHRDKDIRASYYIYENGDLSQFRINYNLEKTILDFEKINIFDNNETKRQFVDFLKNAYSDVLLKKDIKAMKENQLKQQESKNG